MKLMLKIAMVGSALAATSAFATTIAPQTGNGELVLYARDTVTNVTYAKGLGLQIDSVATRATIAADTTYTYPTGGTIAYSLPNTSLDANWTTFKNAAGSDPIVWTVLAGDNPLNSNAVGSERYLTTTQVNMTTGAPNPPSNSILRGTYAQLNGLQTDMLGVGSSDGASIILAGNAGKGWGNPTGLDNHANTWFSTIGISNENPLGTAGNFYLVASGGGGTSSAGRVYTLAGITLDASGLLHAAAVPLPAAVWLFGSGLLGLVGIGRRKQVAAVA
ncbi:MAG TPA: VPLPA-CTERM sorting domain-containing protein [Steroidobacteraceae bacterium]|jgi:hypothetical protein|nr:VPLPA-CTERM sorting domain-containing protein [Steroidobacteraceae bacterium]